MVGDDKGIGTVGVILVLIVLIIIVLIFRDKLVELMTWVCRHLLQKSVIHVTTGRRNSVCLQRFQ